MSQHGSCHVESGHLLSDLWHFVTSEIFVMAISSLSYIAALLRAAEQKHTFVTIPSRYLDAQGYWMFWEPTDPFLPPNLHFFNESSSEDTMYGLKSSVQINKTQSWLHSLLCPSVE